jgi:hypothetical protein
MTIYYSNASIAEWVAPGELPGSISVLPSPENPGPIGIASEVDRIGGFDWDKDRDLGPREAVWSLAIGKEPVEGRFALRAGRFVELAEDVG